AECAAHALAVREPYGVWGGLTEDEREELMGRARNRLMTAGSATTASAPASAMGRPTAGHTGHTGHTGHN
ncbi:WhiB family transcriptional regulator, partial [Streptomyces sp.]|uniref:WhiB family transcriptional regulator n=1 Tax=Streptomyces sp. TaxID=1931 RepID=UPI0028119584